MMMEYGERDNVEMFEMEKVKLEKDILEKDKFDGTR